MLQNSPLEIQKTQSSDGSSVTRHLSNQRDYDNPTSPRGGTNYQKCTLGSDAISFHPRDITFRSPRNSISRTSRRRWLFNLLACGKKGGGGEEGGGRNAWKEGSVLLPRRRGKKGEAHTRNGFFSPHPPREIIDSQRGNDVVNTTSVAHPLEPARFFSPFRFVSYPPSVTRRHLLAPLLLRVILLCFLFRASAFAPPACTIHVLQLIRRIPFSFFVRILFFISFIFRDDLF